MSPNRRARKLAGYSLGDLSGSKHAHGKYPKSKKNQRRVARIAKENRKVARHNKVVR